MRRPDLAVCTALVVVAALLSFAVSVEAYQSTEGAVQSSNAGRAAEGPALDLEAAAANQRTDLPEWAYSPSPQKAPRPPDDGTLLHIPGSAKAYSRTQINDPYGAPDWFPETHPSAPKPVTEGNKPNYAACGECHLANGNGKPDTAGLNGLPAAYILQQLEDFKAGRRHASVAHMTARDMIPIARGISLDEAKAASDYFASVKPARWIRVVETDTVPKTEFAGHRFVVLPDAGTEPVANRVIEVPENEAFTVMRDSLSGFVAYVPRGSVKKGEDLVRTGGKGKTTACVVCHGQDLRGMGSVVPPIAGRSPSSTARQIYDFKTGARNGTNAALMKIPVANLTDEDVVDITAYLASLDQ